jgi:hypothetical protein
MFVRDEALISEQKEIIRGKKLIRIEEKITGGKSLLEMKPRQNRRESLGIKYLLR